MKTDFGFLTEPTLSDIGENRIPSYSENISDESVSRGLAKVASILSSRWFSVGSMFHSDPVAPSVKLNDYFSFMII